MLVNEDIARIDAVAALAFDEEHPATVARGLEHARRHPRQVGALLVAVAQFGAHPVAPGPDEHHQQQDHQQHRPAGAQHRAHETRQPDAAGKPDRHLALAVHAAERDDDGDEQRQRQHRRQVSERDVAQHQHHVLRRDRATGRLAQGADQHHRDDDGQDHHQGRAERARQLPAYS